METLTTKTPKPSVRLIKDETALEKRDRLLRGVNPETIRNAWFALSHVFLDENALVVDIGCHDGAMTYAMAVMRPKLRFIGMDKNRREINKARETFQLPNLDYKVGDATTDVFEPESVDCIINSYTLHSIYSGSRYSEHIVQKTLDAQFSALKKEGFMFIRDYTRPPPLQYILMEMPDTPSKGEAIKDLSEPDFLVWYSENARPRNDPGTGGFFVEELPPRLPKTRLFRLPYKWAYEFILRKDNRAQAEQELPIEYTFFTAHDFEKTVRNMGARVRYCGPHWDDDTVEKYYEGRFTLYMDNGTFLGSPPTCFVMVAQKMAERRSLHIEERRPSSSAENKLTITTMRDNKSGRLCDVVARNERTCDILPYCVDSDGFLKVYLHDGVARSVTNAVARAGENIHGKKWSGHMIDAIAVDEALLAENIEDDEKRTALLCRDYLGLTPKNGAKIEKGSGYYPAPDFINEFVQTFYLEVQHAPGSMTPKPGIAGLGRFQARGKIRELDAQQVLDAIGLGLIPNSKLELQILALFNHLKIPAESWIQKKVNIKRGEITARADLAKIVTQLKASQTRFKDIKGSAGELRAVHSVFVEEGHTRGTISGLSAQDVDFVVHDHETVNRAVVLPLTKNMKHEVHAGFLLDAMPVPEKRDGKSVMICAPTFELPREITNYRLARKFIAEKFAVLPEMVIKMGEPYYTHVDMTPQKMYPFAVAVPPDFMEDPNIIFLPLYQLALLNRRNDLNKSMHMMTMLGRSFKYLGDDLKFDAAHESKMMANIERTFKDPDWGFPIHYEQPAFLKENPASVSPQSYNDLKSGTPFHAQAETARVVTSAKPLTNKPQPISENEFEEDVSQFLSDLKQFDEQLKPDKW